MIDNLKTLVPESVKTLRNNWLKNRRMNRIIKKDRDRFAEYSYGVGELTYAQIEARITKEYHSIEKGLSYQNLRLGFGKQVIKTVVDLMDEYKERGFSLNTHVYQTALSCLNQYIKVHEENNYNVSELKKKFNDLKKDANFGETGGVNYKNKQDIIKSSKSSFEEFALSRHSVRDYSEIPVSHEKIDKALKLASHTPSACNRQPWKVRVVEDPLLKKEIQKNQNGNRVFGDYIDKFIIITMDIQYYERSRERNQANIDGGMYAMNLLYSLHYHQIATIPLSASLTIEQEDNLRDIFEISESENFIMFIGIGNYTDEFKVPKSNRRPVEYIKY